MGLSAQESWELGEKLVAPTGYPTHYFGQWMEMDSTHLYVSDIQENLDENDSNFVVAAGAVYAYVRNDSGQYELSQKLVSEHRQIVGLYGRSIASNGEYLFVGCDGDDTDADGGDFKRAAGAVYVYKKNVDGELEFHQKLVETDRDEYFNFGYKLVLNEEYAAIYTRRPIVNPIFPWRSIVQIYHLQPDGM
jgi:hypothetical protein